MRFQIKIAVMLWAWDFWHSHPDGARGSKLQSDRKLRRNRLRHGEVAAKVDMKELDPPTVCFTWSTPGSSGGGISCKFHEKDNRYYFYTCLQNSTEWVFRWVRKKIMFSGFWSTYLAWVGLNTILTPVGRSLHILWKREVITLLHQNFMWDCHTHVFFKGFWIQTFLYHPFHFDHTDWNGESWAGSGRWPFASKHQPVPSMKEDLQGMWEKKQYNILSLCIRYTIIWMNMDT